ncbi:MAG TPA: alpha/beta fold hydrolase, partial [Gemmatimonadota bacterium]|nr:alpha/beta fold hydrolase [Gemmatimonadota bacterium]
MTILPLILGACTPWAATGPALALAPADTLVDTGDYRIHVEVIRGERPVAFVLESGGGAELSTWEAVPESIAARTGATVVTYDRAGFGGSDLGPEDLAPDEQVQDLREALNALGIPRPRVLVGHSYGGLMAMRHAARHPDEVAGVILVDAMNRRFVEATGDFIHGTVPSIPDPRTDRERALARLVATFDTFLELVDDAAVAQPMAVITAHAWWGRDGVEDPEIEAAWRASHEAIAAAA